MDESLVSRLGCWASRERDQVVQISRLAFILLVVATTSLFSLPFATSAWAQEGETVFTGFVIIDGGAASEETVVRVALEDGEVLGVAFTGDEGLAPNEYRLVVASSPAL